MLSSFWEGVGGKLSDAWVAAIVAPAAIFWAGGFAAWVLADGWIDSGERMIHWFDDLSGAEQGIVLVGALLALSASAVVASALVPTLLRLLEGYWPIGFGWARFFLTDLRSRYLGRKAAKFQNLAGCIADARSQGKEPSAKDQAQLVRLDLLLSRAPSQKAMRMPTRLGNVLRASETRPLDKYGLNAITTWPLMWLVVDDNTRTTLDGARGQLDQAVAVFFWGLLLLVWIPWTCWVIPASIAVCAFAYFRAVASAAAYGDLVEAVFDLYRFDLYAQLRIAAPVSSRTEIASGVALSEYLWRGKAGVRFVTPKP